MVTKHFFKVLFVFTLMIIVGLFGVFLMNYLNQGEVNKVIGNKPVAK